MPDRYASMAQYGQVPTIGGSSRSLGDLNLDTSVDASLLDPMAGFNLSDLIAQPQQNKPTFMEGMLGTPERQGWGGLALGTASSMGNLYLGMQQYGMAKDQLKQNRRQFEANYNNQRTLTNAHMEDRQRARVASNPNAYQSVGEYMEQNRIR